MIDYHYAVMAQQELLKNQVIEEILREKVSYYSIRKKLPDFWVLVSPNFLSSPEIRNKIYFTNFYKEKEHLISTTFKNTFRNESSFEFYAALVSLDINFLEWIKLRLGHFENLNKTSDPVERSFNSDGIFGSFSDSKKHPSFNPLSSFPTRLHPDLLTEKNKKFN